MPMKRWNPSRTMTRQEKLLLNRLGRVRKLFAFLYTYRHELFDDGFQTELESMYRKTGAGKSPVPPALLAMTVLIQGYMGISDAEAIEMTVVDLRWQLVLDQLGATKPMFSQGTLQNFRQRLIHTDMDRRLLERTVDLARKTKAFDPKKLPKSLRVAMDSSPLNGAGRVEDTINLLGHAARKVVECAADLLGCEFIEVAKQAGIQILLDSSIKKGLDCEWSDPKQKKAALQKLINQLTSLLDWIDTHLAEETSQPPLKEPLEVLEQIFEQDLEPDPKNQGKLRIKQGVAPDRRVSIEDSDMRHGRKSKSKLFNGYKRHIAVDIDNRLILACAITKANRPEEEAAPDLQDDIHRQQLSIGELYIDRGYIKSTVVDDVLESKGDVFCKPWVSRNTKGKYTKSEFRMDFRSNVITCPGGQSEPFYPGAIVEFDSDVCDCCQLRKECTMASHGRGRTVSIANDEKLQQRFKKQISTIRGRERLRSRTVVEHNLAHISQRQGNRARYKGVRNNLFELRRTSAIQNLETMQRMLAA